MLEAHDDWAVGPDGRVAIIRNQDSRWNGGSPTEGPWWGLPTPSPHTRSKRRTRKPTSPEMQDLRDLHDRCDQPGWERSANDHESGAPPGRGPPQRRRLPVGRNLPRFRPDRPSSPPGEKSGWSGSSRWTHSPASRCSMRRACGWDRSYSHPAGESSGSERRDGTRGGVSGPEGRIRSQMAGEIPGGSVG